VVLSKGYTKAYGFRGDGSITYTSSATNRMYPIIERFVRFLTPNQTVDFHVYDSKMYLLAESGSYATATFNLFMISTGASSDRNIYKINGVNGSLQFVDNNTIRFTYEYQGGGDSCYFSLISLY
jgi:hypothetical protein